MFAVNSKLDFVLLLMNSPNHIKEENCGDCAHDFENKFKFDFVIYDLIR